MTERASGGNTDTCKSCDDLEKKIECLNRVNQALMNRVERGMNLQEDAFSLFQAATSLEGKVRERTDALEHALRRLEDSNRDLEIARGAAEQANRAKSDFLANMSHEIRTPINGVLGMTELLYSTGLNRRQRQLADTIRTSAVSLLDIINDILDLSKIESGKLELDETEIDVREIVEDIGDLFAERAQSKGLELVTSIPPKMRTTYVGDPVRLRQVLTNLVGNAIKFTYTGEIVIGVCLVENGDDGTTLKFSIRDSGIGISPEAQERIFESFAQADGSTTRKFGGTGLGLTICRQLVELMGGAIDVQGQPGRGSVFWFTAKLKPSDHTIEPSGHEDLRGVRVLVVDDNSTSANVLCNQLNAWGMRSQCTSDPHCALDLLRSEKASGDPFDLVLLDASLPDSASLDIACAVGDDSEFEQLRTIVLISVTDTDAEAWKRAGVASCVVKPVRQSLLCNSLMGAIHDTEDESWSVQDAAPASGPVRFHGKVLLAEDNLINQQVASGMLTEFGVEVDIVANGVQALSALSNSEYDLVLMDCQMPEMDGLEATEEVRRVESEQSSAERIPIVALTASALAGDRERCLAAGMDSYMSKPFTRAQLQSLLTSWLPFADEDGNRVSEGAAGTRASAHVSAGLIDENAIDQLRGGDPKTGDKIVATVVELYIDETSDQIELLNDALRESDPKRIGKISHHIKSSTASVGAHSLAALLAELEQCSESDPDRTKELISEVNELFPLVAGELQRIAGAALVTQ